MTENKRFSLKMNYKDKGVKIFDNFDKENQRLLNLPFMDYEDTKIVREQLKPVVDKLNEQEDKLKRIEKEVNNCNIYRDDLKDIILEIRCILNGDVE